MASEKKASKWAQVSSDGQAVTIITFRTASGKRRKVTHDEGLRILFENDAPDGFTMTPVVFHIQHTAAPRGPTREVSHG